MYNNIQQMYATSQAENRRLRMANEELVQGLSEIEEPSEEHTEEAQIRRLLRQGMSIRKIAEILQIPKCRVERVKHQEYTPDSDIVVIGGTQESFAEGVQKCQ